MGNTESFEYTVEQGDIKHTFKATGTTGNINK